MFSRFDSQGRLWVPLMPSCGQSLTGSVQTGCSSSNLEIRLYGHPRAFLKTAFRAKMPKTTVSAIIGLFRDLPTVAKIRLPT
jgi:hypothetical protein